MVCMFSHWMEALPGKQDTAFTVGRVLSEKIIPIWGIPLKLHSDLIWQARYFRESALSGQFYNTFTVLTTLSPLNTVMALVRLSWQNLEALQLPWPLVPLNLRSTPFRTHTFLPFEIVTGHPMYLTPSSFDPQLIKREMVQYLKGLIVFTKNSTCFGRAIFSQCILGRWRP